MTDVKKVEGGVEYSFPDEKEVKKDVPEVTDEGESDVEINVVDDTPESDRGHKPGVSRDVADVTDEELSAYSTNVQKRIKELSFARHDERRAKEAVLRERQELERMAQVVLEENKRLKQYVQTGEQAFQGTAKSAAQAKIDIAKRKFKEAHEAFDADALVAAQQELMQAQLEMTAAENFRPTALQTLPNQVYGQPTEAPRPDSRAEDWQGRNRWFGDNKRMTAFALAVHQELVESGVDPRSDEYYKRIDASVRETFPKYFGAEEVSAGSQPHRKPATVVAPTARSSSAKKITLTQTQVNLAKKFGIPLEEYAKHAALLETSDGR